MKKILIKIIRNIIYGVIGLVSALSVILAIIESLIKKALKKMSFRTKLVVFTLLVVFLIANREKIVNVTENISTYELNPVMVVKAEEPIKECKYGEIECKIYDESIKQGLTEEQAKIAIAISKHETGSYKSNLCVKSNNFGGLYYNGSFMKFNTIEEGIEAYVRNLKKGYFDKGLDTIEKIQKKYCPVGAKNDPTGLNKNWTSGVKYFYNNL